MASLTPLTALGGITAYDETIGSIRITEIADTCLASLAMRRGKAAGFRKAAKKTLGTDLPAPGQRTGNGTHGVIWMGPDQYLVEVETGMTASMTDLAGELATGFGAAASRTVYV